MCTRVWVMTDAGHVKCWCVYFTGVLAQVDEIIDREERKRCCCALNKELKAIDDDIRFAVHKLYEYSCASLFLCQFHLLQQCKHVLARSKLFVCSSVCRGL